MVKSEYPTKSGQEVLHENSSLFTLRSSLTLLLKQNFTQVLQSLLLILLSDEERDVVVAAAVRNHAYRDVLHRIGSEGLEAYVAPVEVAYYADDAHV